MAGVLIGSEHFVYSDSGKISRSLEFDGTGRQTHNNDFVCRTKGNRVETTSETEGKFIGRTVEVYDGELLLSFASYDGNNLLKREKIFKYVGKNPKRPIQGFTYLMARSLSSGYPAMTLKAELQKHTA